MSEITHFNLGTCMRRPDVVACWHAPCWGGAARARRLYLQCDAWLAGPGLSAQPDIPIRYGLSTYMEGSAAAPTEAPGDASPTAGAKAAKTVTKEQLLAMLSQEKFKKRFLKQKCAECGGEYSQASLLPSVRSCMERAGWVGTDTIFM